MSQTLLLLQTHKRCNNGYLMQNAVNLSIILYSSEDIGVYLIVNIFGGVIWNEVY